ncbi:MAG TPA: acyl-CoA dehydrogenase family protein, partial [Acidimicrobiia bacterium]|nr:acyl-CoA dehydrogenase family protein [Acidimicrobiia bacterium]
MDRDELELVRASMRQLLTECGAADVPAQLLESGWGELVGDDPATAVSVLAEEQGRTLAATPVLDLVLLHGAGLPLDPTTAFVLPRLQRASTPSSVEGDTISIDGLVLAGHERASSFLVLAPGAAIVAVSPGDLRFEPVAGGDPDLGLHRALGEVRTADVQVVASADASRAALAAGRRALAAELIGLSERMLDDTVAYVVDRQQFGRPIATFQTVKHRLADVKVATSSAHAALRTAWLDDDATSAVAAKCLAGRASRVAATNCHQVHGG